MRPSLFPARGRETDRAILGARSLAYLALPWACPACFRIQLAQKGDMPYSFPPPGLLLQVDSFVKTAVRVSLDVHGRLPDWLLRLRLPGLDEACGYRRGLTYKRFRRHDFASGLTVCGVPDEVLVLPDGGLHIIDYKAARFTKGQTSVLPLYEAQLNIYAYIARRLTGSMQGQPAHLSLLYLEPCTDLADAEWDGDRLTLPFEPKAIEVDLRGDAYVQGLLAEAADILRCEEMDTLRHRKGCRELDRLDHLIEVQTGDPFVAYWGRYQHGRCVLCGELQTLVADRPLCRCCAGIDSI